MELYDGQDDDGIECGLEEKAAPCPYPHQEESSNGRAERAHHGPTGLVDAQRTGGQAPRHENEQDGLAQRVVDGLGYPGEQTEKQKGPDLGDAGQEGQADACVDHQEPAIGEEHQ